MPITSEEFQNELDALIQSKHLLHHDFYQAWSRGELSMDCLREYAKDYYHHVKAFPMYLSLILSRTEDVETRRILLQNLIEEEGGCPNHPELWKNFAVRLGVSEDELKEHVPSEEIKSLISQFREICAHGTLVEAIAALYAYESQIPSVSISKIEGLKKFYGKKDPRDWEYFTVHISADQAHAAEERGLLSKYFQEQNIKRVRLTVNNVLDGLLNFLTGISQRYQICQHNAFCSLT